MKERTMKLFQRFIASEFPLSRNTLCEDFKISQRTVQNEITELNSYLIKWHLPVIQTIRGKGFQLQLSDCEKESLIELFKQENQEVYFTREERVFDLLLDIALGTENVFFYKKEEQYKISKSSLDEDIRRVRAIVKNYPVEIISVPKQGIVLSGKEPIIRTMLYATLTKESEKFSLVDTPPHPSIMQQILFKYLPYETFKKLDKLYDQSISANEETIYRKNILLFTGVWLKRNQENFVIRATSWEKKIDGLSNDIQTFVSLVVNTFGLTDRENEINYLLFMLNTFNSKDMHSTVEWGQAQILSLQLIQHVEEETKIPFTHKEERLQEGLYKHIAGLLNRMRYDIQLANPLKENIQRGYHSIYQAISNFSKEFSKVTGKVITEDELAFLTIHFSTTESELNQEIDYVYRVVVICNHGVATGKLLAENLQELFPIEVLAVLSSREVHLISKLDVDLVFSTLMIQLSFKPLLVIEPIIKESSKELIHQFLEKNIEARRLVHIHEDSTSLFNGILELLESQKYKVTKETYERLETVFRENNLVINTREIQPMIKDVLNDQSILIKKSANNWQESIQLAAQPLLEQKIITKHYIQAMIQAVEEFGPYIVIGPHIALAHARPEEGAKELGLSALTLDEPILFGHEDNDPVKIIFCLSAIDSYSHLNIMKNLIDLINDEKRIEELAQSESVSSFKKILFD
ncbi:hypothetical protein IGI37_002636 [Enterococcus sp. AZ194]|uniref:BglG family transcription antiterminator n=1 Tax=Enterococcus sp. AZ194 TaxID=2774629 RepID=UPI003F22D580